ncbi:hypothetical protein BH11GEM2_BH11GEM2_33630 [soil metagenome]
MRSRHAVALLVCTLLGATQARAQKPNKLATMSGRILADSTERPLFGAQISVPALRITVTADLLGNFRLDGIKTAGRQLITVTHMGFEQLKTYVAFAASDTMDADILLTPIAVRGAKRISKMSVTADAVPRGLEGFERRRQSGIGDFLTEGVIRKASRGELTDVVRRIPGIQFSRPQSGFGAYASAGRVPRGRRRNGDCTPPRHVGPASCRAVTKILFAAGIGPQQIAHAAGLRNARVTDMPDTPLYTAANARLDGFTLGTWLGAAGTVSLANTQIVVDLTGLRPGGVYSLFENHFDQSPVGFTPLDGTGSTNTVVADTQGRARVTVTVPSVPTHDNAVLVVYHSDGVAHGTSRGMIGVNAHHQLIARIP